MEKLIPSISIKNCQEALEFYKEVFNGEIKNVKTTDENALFEYYEGRILHAEFYMSKDSLIYFSDAFDVKSEGSNISLLLQCESEEEINHYYSSLSKDATVIYELQKTFWGSLHALVKDRFGVVWAMDYQVNEGLQ
jgi:PhnB protein